MKFCVRVRLKCWNDRGEFALDRPKSKNNIAENSFALGHETHNRTQMKYQYLVTCWSREKISFGTSKFNPSENQWFYSIFARWWLYCVSVSGLCVWLYHSSAASKLSLVHPGKVDLWRNFISWTNHCYSDTISLKSPWHVTFSELKWNIWQHFINPFSTETVLLVGYWSPIAFLLLAISSWNFHDVCQRFLYNQEKISAWSDKKWEISPDPHYKNRPLL